MRNIMVPAFAFNYPVKAETLEQTRLPFYCANCQQKRMTRYLTPNFGPFCLDCFAELNTYIEAHTK